MRSLSFWLLSLLSTILSPAFASPTSTFPRNSRSSFITASSNTLLFPNGSKFAFVGTNAYWLPYLNSDDDINNTLANMSASGITVVRTWAFNDVTSIPAAGSWLQVIASGTTKINTGPNGLQRLDRLVELATKHNIYVIFALTNNWNPTSGTSPSPVRRWATPALPRNFLSNDYGGMDAYVREFGAAKTHDEFYTHPTILRLFKSYTQAVISRFINHPHILAWELANDPRCNSTVSASSSCKTTTVTRWHADLAAHVRSIDPNHLITSGNHGFFCPSCPKLFSKPRLFSEPSPPSPRPSPAPGSTRKRKVGGLSVSKLRQLVTYGRRAASPTLGSRDGVTIRGRWTASSEPTRQKRQAEAGDVGPAFDGSFGVDSQDILSIPNITLGSFQLFPDQNNYGNIQSTSPSSDFSGTLEQGIVWIQTQRDFSISIGKPVILTGFGLVTANNLAGFVPFNDTSPVIGPPSQNQKRQTAATVGTGVPDGSRDSAYGAWLQVGLGGGLSGMNQYQWSAQGLVPAAGTVVQNPAGAGGMGVSPNDGYGTQGVGQANVQQTLQNGKQNIT